MQDGERRLSLESDVADLEVIGEWRFSTLLPTLSTGFEKLIDYVATIVARTRNSPDLLLGASPRASLAIVSAAKGMAAMSGRDFVTPEDIRRVLPPVLRHRLILTPEREMQGSRADDVITAIVESVETPR